MSPRHKVLLLDDDQDLLEVYREILARLPSKPEIYTATSGARAITLLETEPFTLLLSDLNMPRMDGLQVLSIVRRKFPKLRTAVMTSVLDEHFRSRAYAMGIDLYLEKPSTGKEINFFLDCVESLLGRGDSEGFRGMQSKSLVDLIQLECLSRSSSVLRITHGTIEGRIWITDGDVIDAAVGELTGQEAFQTILGWKNGNFEIFPGEPKRRRTIFTSSQGLLLETAQALDESRGGGEQGGEENSSPLSGLSRFPGVEYLLSIERGNGRTVSSWGVEEEEPLARWVESMAGSFSELGEQLRAGALTRWEAAGPHGQLAAVIERDRLLCVGFHRHLGRDQMRETMNQIINAWG